MCLKQAGQVQGQGWHAREAHIHSHKQREGKGKEEEGGQGEGEEGGRSPSLILDGMGRGKVA